MQKSPNLEPEAHGMASTRRRSMKLSRLCIQPTDSKCTDLVLGGMFIIPVAFLGHSGILPLPRCESAIYRQRNTRHIRALRPTRQPDRRARHVSRPA